MRNRKPVSDKETDFSCKNYPEGFNRPPSKDGKYSQALGVLILGVGCEIW